MAFAHDLLEQARHLASPEPMRPRQASLRRTISTAYYALFHLLTTAAVMNWRTPRHRAQLARAFEHRRMNEACSKWTRTEVLEQIESAQAAFECWSVISHEEIAQDFLLQLMVPR